MKKFICLLTVMTMLISQSFSAYAATDTDYTDDIIILTPDSFYALFDEQTLDEVRYADQIDVVDENEAYVEINIRLSVGNAYYYGSASGQVKLYQASESYTVWQGGLDGSIIVNGMAYLLSVGYSRVVQTQGVQLCCNIQSTEGYLEDSVLFATSVIRLDEEATLNDLYHIGETEELAMENLNSPNEGISITVIKDPITPSPGPDAGGGGGISSNYVYKGLDDVYFSDSRYEGYACTTWIYFDPTLNAVSVSAVPYGNHINDYYVEYYEDLPTNKTIVTDIDSIEYTLACTSTTVADGKCHILGIDEPTVAELEEYPEISLTPWFEDLMSLLGIPTSTIEAVLASLNGSVEETAGYMNRRTYKVSFGFGSSQELAERETKLPIVYYLAKPSDTYYEGGSKLRASNIIKYRTYISINDSNALPRIFYTITEQTKVEFEVDLT